MYLIAKSFACNTLVLMNILCGDGELVGIGMYNLIVPTRVVLLKRRTSLVCGTWGTVTHPLSCRLNTISPRGLVSTIHSPL